MLKWQDLHKVLELWSLPFHTMVAFTGAFLGVISLLSPVMTVLAFKGGTASLVVAVFGDQQKPAGIEVPMLPVDHVAAIRFTGVSSDLLLGLILCIVSASGLMMWIERRSKGCENNAFYRRIGITTIGVTIGLPIASMAIFYLDKLYSGLESNRMLATGCTYFIVWVAVIVFACVKHSEYKTIRQLLLILGGLLLAIPLLNYFSTGGAFWTQLGTQQSWVGVDIVCFIMGLLTCLLSRNLPIQRPKSAKRATSIA